MVVHLMYSVWKQRMEETLHRLLVAHGVRGTAESREERERHGHDDAWSAPQSRGRRERRGQRDTAESGELRFQHPFETERGWKETNLAGHGG